MQVLLVELIVKPEHIAAFHAAIVRNAQASVTQERSCRRFDVCIDPARPGRLLLCEVDDNDAAIQANLASQHFLDMDPLTAGWFESKTVTRLQRVAP